ncbi:long-chain fatty acid transport protein 4-like isoform X1 [Neodiprion fabricii]|uniref:long-chain fatty acid transport protein 4-like isoform X1 n=1 Tax=Neodiprion fabricii TaxID=2872261 RepID=UPI001ED8EB6A|nr:long-chain fatty acid transport protein 4-like isoform X1 [Neodiprion fabricii]
MTELNKLLLSVGAVLLGGFLFTGNRRRMLYILYKTLPRDILGSFRFLRVNILLWWWESRGFTVAEVFARLAAAHPDHAAFVFEDKEWTYQQLEEFSNRVARFFRSRQGLARGDSIALIMDSRPEYVGFWLGLSKVGLVAALVNTNLRHEVLIHSIRAADCKAVIFGSELADAVNEVKDGISGLTLYRWPDVPTSVRTSLPASIDLSIEFSKISGDKLSADGTQVKCSPRDKLIYIYTSGTTGMPKAAVITNLRYMLMSCGVHSMLGLRTTDRIYDALPLYHTAGGIVGAGQALLRGITVVLRRRFSASKFWPDCVHYECTVELRYKNTNDFSRRSRRDWLMFVAVLSLQVAQYIGEICRYLLAIPPSSTDTSHSVRLMFGNGLKAQIWGPFVERFRVKQIGEFYGATEGNSNLVNIDSRVGSVGFVPRYAGALYPVALLRVDEETGEPLRGPDGFCIPCQPGEAGVFVGKINPKKAVNDFSGYVDKKASEKKIILDVFKKGDRVFNSGDILVMDDFGYFYFKDRTGDTFRWRGENVATSEVEAVISNVVGLRDAAVYGVEVPGTEGKAGMAAIYDPERSLNLNKFAEAVKHALPAYARPLFIRILTEFSITGTFKIKKRDLQLEAFDVKKINDPVYFLDKTGFYVRLTEQLYTDIVEQRVRL